MSNEEKITMLEKKLKTLQMYYAAALADSVYRYGTEGILDKIIEQKRAEQLKGGAEVAVRLGVKEPKNAFENVQELCGCANWICTDTENGFEAVATSCMLCTISKKMGNFSPCQIYCLSPIEAMLKSVSPNADIFVMDTLWNSDKCKVNIKLE